MPRTGTRRDAALVVKSHRTALVLIPPKECWPPIQAIRERHDTRWQRWMPHLSLVYPFAPPETWEQLFPRLLRVCADQASFRVRLTRFGYFKHGGGGFSLWVAPEDPAPLRVLRRELLRAAPGYGEPGGFEPHLSLGQVARRASLERLLTQFETDWPPLEFQAHQVLLLRRGTPPEDVFTVVRGFPFAAPGPANAEGCDA